MSCPDVWVFNLNMNLYAMKHQFYIQILCGMLLAIISNQVSSQNLPADISFSADGHMLVSGAKRVTGFYDTTSVKDLKLYFAQADYWAQLTTLGTSGGELLGKMMYQGVTYDSIGVSFKGNTSYSGVRNLDKKSFGINLTYKKENQNVLGYETLNLNNAYQDESGMREVIYAQLARRHAPVVKANFVHLYINDKDWGIYPNAQQINGEYIKEWWFSNDGTRWRAERSSGTTGGGGGFGTGTSGLNYLGADTTSYKPYYTLKKTKQTKPWEALVTTATKLNQTTLTELETTIANYLDLDRTLWFLATEIAFGDDDSYVNKGGMDYYLYWDPETKRMTPIEVDGNSALETSRASWSPFLNATSANFPLLSRLLAVPAFRQRYLAHMRTINEEFINPTMSHALIDATAKKIDALVKADPKALYTYTQYQSELTVLKSFFTTRYNYLKTQAEVNRIAPIISKTTYASNNSDWTPPTEKNTVWVRSTANSTEGVAKVWLYYSNALTGVFTKKEMLDDGKNNDGTAKDGIYGAEIPAYASGQYVRFYIEAVSANAVATVSYDPVGAEHDVYVYQVAFSSPVTKTVSVNEVVASNTIYLDENKQAEDWIELYNLTDTAVDLSGYFLSDNASEPKKWTFPKGTTIAAKDYLIVWADEDLTQGPLHANFKLSKSGESVYLATPGGVIMDQVSFGSQQDDMGYARMPNGTGNFVIQKMTYATNNEANTITNPTVVLAVGNPALAELKIYPNPATEYITISASSKWVGKEAHIFSATGQLVASKSLDVTTQIPTANWPSGLYFVRIAGVSHKILITN